MSYLRRRLQRFSWLALWAMLAFALLPTVSQALAHAEATYSFGDICRAPGAAAADAGDPSPAGAFSHLGQHCPFCGQADHLPGLAPCASVQVAQLPGAAPRPLPSPQAPRDATARWLAAAHKQGPPARA